MRLAPTFQLKSLAGGLSGCGSAGVLEEAAERHTTVVRAAVVSGGGGGGDSGGGGPSGAELPGVRLPVPLWAMPRLTDRLGAAWGRPSGSCWRPTQRQLLERPLLHSLAGLGRCNGA